MIRKGIILMIIIGMFWSNVSGYVFPNGVEVATTIEMNGFSIPIAYLPDYIHSLPSDPYIISYYGFIKLSDAMKMEPLMTIDFSNFSFPGCYNDEPYLKYFNFSNNILYSLNPVTGIVSNYAIASSLYLFSPFANFELFNFQPVINGTIYAFSLYVSELTNPYKQYFILLDKPIVFKNIPSNVNYITRVQINIGAEVSAFHIMYFSENSDGFEICRYYKAMTIPSAYSIIDYAKALYGTDATHPTRVTTFSDVYSLSSETDTSTSNTITHTINPSLKTYFIHIRFDYGLTKYFAINRITIYDNKGDLVYDINRNTKDFSIKAKSGYIYYANVSYSIFGKQYSKITYFYLPPNQDNIYIKINHFKDLIVFDFEKQTQFSKIFENENTGFVTLAFINSLSDVLLEDEKTIFSLNPGLFFKFTQKTHCYSIGTYRTIEGVNQLIDIPCNDTTVDFMVYEIRYPQIEASLNITTQKSLFYFDKNSKQLHILIPNSMIDYTKSFNYTVFQLKYDDGSNSVIFVLNNDNLWTTNIDLTTNTTYETFKTLNLLGEVVNFQILFNLDVLTVLNPFKLEKKTVIYDDTFNSVHFQENPVLVIQEGYFTKTYSFENIGKDSENLVVINFNLANGRPLIEVVTQSSYNSILQKFLSNFTYIILGLGAIIFILSRNIILTLMGVGLITLIYSVLTFNYYALIFALLSIIVSAKSGGVSR